MPNTTLLRSLAAAATLCATAAAAQPTTDAAGDFLATYAGPHDGDLDVLSAAATFHGAAFTFSATLAGAIGTTPNAVYVWGVDRGRGTSPGGVFPTAVTFDAVVVFNPAGGSVVRDLLANTVTPLANVLFTGNTIGGTVPLAMLPTTGFDPAQYTVNLWPRIGAGNNALIADFAPDAGNMAVTATPEPMSLALVGAGALLLVPAARRRRRTV